VGHEKENNLVLVQFQFHNRKSLFAVLHSDIAWPPSFNQSAIYQKE